MAAVRLPNQAHEDVADRPDLSGVRLRLRRPHGPGWAIGLAMTTTAPGQLQKMGFPVPQHRRQFP
jgi:hypothetical protein